MDVRRPDAVVGKRHYGRKAVPHGGGGGRDRARQSFDTLLQWRVRVPVDAEGNARVEIPLNDALTSFRIVAVASGGEHAFGTGSASISTSQDVVLLSGLQAAVLDWLDILQRLPDVRSKASRIAAAENVLRSRLTLHGGAGRCCSTSAPATCSTRPSGAR